MCEASIEERDREIKEFVLATLLYEILKDGEVDAKEKEMIQSLGPVLGIPNDRARAIQSQVMGKIPKVKEEGSASFVNLFEKVRSKLLERYKAETTDSYLEKLAKTMGREAEFMDSLSMGF